MSDESLEFEFEQSATPENTTLRNEVVLSDEMQKLMSDIESMNLRDRSIIVRKLLKSLNQDPKSEEAIGNLRRYMALKVKMHSHYASNYHDGGSPP